MEPNQDVPAGISSPPAAGCHRLPQLPSMGRNVRTAQSKSSAKLTFETKPRDEAVLHIEGTSKVVKILTDGISELTEFESKESVPSIDPNANSESLPLETSEAVEDKDISTNENDSVGSKKKRQRKTGAKRGKNMDTEKPVVIGDNNLSSSKAPDNEVCDSLKQDSPNKSSELSGETSVSQLPANSSDSVTETNVSEKDSIREVTDDVDELKKRESPLEKKKRTSKLGVEGKSAESSVISKSSDREEETPMEEEATDSACADEKMEVTDAPPLAHTPRCVLIMPAEVPSEVQLEKLLAMDSTTYDLQYPPRWSEGDLLWAKVSGHPYWPCMVSRCPFSKMFTKIQGDVRILRSYHVQFFGNEVERGWINEPSLMAFEGKLKFLEQAQVELGRNKKGGRTAYNPFKINISRRHAWNISVEEAEGAMPLSMKDRIMQYAFEYIFMDELKKEQQKLKKELLQEKDSSTEGSSTPKAGRKRKRGPAEGNTPSPAQDKRKRRKLDMDSPSATPSVAETSFDTYYANHRSTVIEQHPEWDTPLVFEYVRQQWEAEKRKTPKSRAGRPRSSGIDKKINKTAAGPSGLSDPSKQHSKLAELLRGGNPYAASPTGTEQQASPNVPRKRGRKPKNAVPQEGHETEVAPSPKAVSNEAADDISALVEDTARPKMAASALSARKVSQESDSSTEGKGKGLKENEPYELEIFKLNSTCKIDKDKICAVCEKNGDVVIDCTGPCGQHFHASCIDESQSSAEQYKCPECTSGIHTCFACKKADIEAVKCSVNLCGKFYHEDCIRKYRLTRVESKGFVCPLHTCATCAVDNVKNPKAMKGRFYRCVRCPTAYHVGDFCMAAGSENLSGSYIVCSDHFQPNRSLSCHSHLNITWCFSCSKGGTLLCCESCPAAFHAECVKVDKTPEEAWFCTDCAAGRKPLYGNIVWIKVGNYRWWPGEICHPRHVPLNIQEKAHQVGEFPVRFFGSHDYYWIHRGRVFLFQEGDKGSKEGSSRGLFKIYMKGVKEATEAFKLWTAAKAKKVEQEQERSEKKPAPYKLIKSSVPIGNVQIHKAELSEIPRCECKPDQEDACNSDCLNRMMMYECHPATCPAGEKCHNQRFQKRQYPECEPFKSETRGWGLRCCEDIKKGQFVQEYVGDLIDEDECKRRIEQAHEDNITNFYMLTMDKNRIIDAGPKGNLSRFMNHSCCPNMETQKWTVNGDIRVGLFALCDISKGSELTFNYNLECLGNEKKACSCGAENCSGFLGVRPKTAAAAANEKKAKEPKKRRRKKKLDPRKEHEDDCFRCGEGGELVMCDKGNCPKVYHLQCLKLTKPPSGKWLCPWHHCDECGKPAANKCSECPNSYCVSHSTDNIFMVDNTKVCSDHTELLEGITQSLSSCTPDGNNGVKSEVESSTSDNDTSESRSIGDEPETKEMTHTDKQAAPVANIAASDDSLKQNGLSSNVEVTGKSNGNGNPKPRGRPKNGKSATRKSKEKSSVLSASANSEKGLGDPSISGGETTPANKMASTSSAACEVKASSKHKSRKKTESSGCRTKARYKAQLVPVGTANPRDPVNTSVSTAANVQKNSPATKSATNDSDDNDSVSDLVIDIP